MATMRHENEVLDEVVRDGERHIQYRWTLSGTNADGKPIDDATGVENAMTRVEEMDRTILLDRWTGLVRPGGNNTELGDQLDKLLWDLAEGVLRREMQEHALTPDGIVGLDMIMEVDELEGVIRDWILDRAGKVAAA